MISFITNTATMNELEANLRASKKTATVNGETFKVFSDQGALRSTFALREADGEMMCLRNGGYITNELTIRKEIALMYHLPTFRKNAAKAC